MSIITSSLTSATLCGSLVFPKTLAFSNEFFPSNHLSTPLESSKLCLTAYPKKSIAPIKGVRCHAMQVETREPFTAGKKFQLSDVIEGQQFDREMLSAIFDVAREMEKIEKSSSQSEILKGYLMATLFYEPSTCTRLSFESAMKRLGGEVLTTENAREFSSAAKGETLEDTIRTVEGYSDIIVMRHFKSGAARKAAATANIPVINAARWHKCSTSWRPCQRKNSQVACILARQIKDVKIYFVSPEVVKMKDDIKDYLTSNGVEWEESSDLMEVASKCDVVYQTRIQRERFGERLDLYEAARGKYIVDKALLGVMQRNAVIMHPLPRLDEITADVDADPRAAYFRQAKNGLFIRMALLKLLLVGVDSGSCAFCGLSHLSPCSFTLFYASVFVAERNSFEKLNLQSWIIPRYNLQYLLKWRKEVINNMIEKAILEANKKGVKVLSLGLMNKGRS
ncbi:hypothetical protein Rs2_26733 [Raphanus sativus]|nr:hypothetical protein Rs2_26733 [Raphanus sativus]